MKNESSHQKHKSIQKITIQIYQLLMFSDTNVNAPATNVRFQLLQKKEFFAIRLIHDCIK